MTSTPAFVRSPGPLREGLNAGFQENADLSSLAQGSGLLDESVMPFGFMEPSVDSLPFPVLTASQQLATEVKSGPQKVGWKARIGLGVEGSGSEDAEVNLDEYGPQARANRSWRHGILSCLSTEDGAGIGAIARTLCMPCWVVQETAELMDMSFPYVHGLMGGVPLLGNVHCLYMRIRIKERFGIHMGIPLPQDVIYAAVLCPCAIIQHRSDVAGGFRRRRDKVIEVRPIQPRLEVIEDDHRWGIKRYIPGQITLADGSLSMGFQSSKRLPGDSYQLSDTTTTLDQAPKQLEM